MHIIEVAAVVVMGVCGLVLFVFLMGLLSLAIDELSKHLHGGKL